MTDTDEEHIRQAIEALESVDWTADERGLSPAEVGALVQRLAEA